MFIKYLYCILHYASPLRLTMEKGSIDLLVQVGNDLEVIHAEEKL
jgi:hypothetical protein